MGDDLTRSGPPTEPIRPQQYGPEPIPERARRPIVVPRQPSTIGGLPRGLVIAAVVALVAALVIGFLVGRSTSDGAEVAAGDQGKTARGGACGKALTLALGVVGLQSQALANRTQAAEAAALDDASQVEQLNSELEALSAALGETRASMTAAVERCRSGKGGGGKGKGGKGGKGGG